MLAIDDPESACLTVTDAEADAILPNDGQSCRDSRYKSSQAVGKAYAQIILVTPHDGSSSKPLKHASGHKVAESWGFNLALRQDVSYRKGYYIIAVEC